MWSKLNEGRGERKNLYNLSSSFNEETLNLCKNTWNEEKLVHMVNGMEHVSLLVITYQIPFVKRVFDI